MLLVRGATLCMLFSTVVFLSSQNHPGGLTHPEPPLADRLNEQQWKRYPNLQPHPQECITKKQLFTDWVRHHQEHVYVHGYARYVDKAAVKHYVRQKVPQLKYPKTLAIFRPDNIDDVKTFDFPKSFAFKAVHGSGMNLLVIDGKIDGKPYTRDRLITKAKNWFEKCYRCEGERIERQYEFIDRAVVVEEFIGNEQPIDYKLYVFNGEVMLVMVKHSYSGDQKAKFRYYFRNWTPLHSSSRPDLEPADPIPKPEELPLLYEYARQLTKGFRFVRMDFYILHGDIYFGEMTFSPAGGNFNLNTAVGDIKAAIGTCEVEMNGER